LRLVSCERRAVKTPLPTPYRRHVIDARVWNSDVIILIGGSQKQWRKTFIASGIPTKSIDNWIPHMEALTPRAATTLFTPDVPWYCHVYFTRDPTHKAVDVGAVAHELFHVVANLLRQKHLDLYWQSEEAYAYFLEYLVREFWSIKRLAR
jgi:hypothetical protein